MNKEEILYNKIYEQTKEFGRTHFIKEIMKLQRENTQLKEDCKNHFQDAEELNQRLTEVIDERNNLLSVLKELRSWLEEYFKGMTIDDIPIDDYYKKGMFRMNEYTLDKLNELEGGKND